MSWVAIAVGVGTAAGTLLKKDNDKATQPAPNYVAAVRDGVNADIETLVNRLQADTAAQAGGVYTDPVTGKTFDFRGSFDPIRFAKLHPAAIPEFQAEQAKGELQGWTAEMFAKAYVNDDQEEIAKFMTGSPAYKNATAIDSAKQLAAAGDDIAANSTKAQAKVLLELTPEFNALNLKAQEDAIAKMVDLMPKVGDAQRVQDTATYKNNLTLGNEGAQNNADLQAKLLPGVNKLSLDQQAAAHAATLAANKTSFGANLDQADEAALRAGNLQKNTLPGLNDLSIRLQTDTLKGADAAGRAVNGGLYGIRDEYAAGLLDELKSGSDLTPAQRNKVQQKIRGAQAARGSMLGNAEAFEEAIAESDYAQSMIDKRRAAALGLINARDLMPNFTSMDVLNPTQVVTPNNAPANFSAVTAVNPMMPNFNSAAMPNLGATTTGVPSVGSRPVQAPDPLAFINPNAGAQGSNYAINAWNSLSNRLANTPNPWLTGVGVAAKTYGTFG